MAMFYKDTAGKMNVVNPLAADDEANLGLKARYEFTKESHTVDMMGPIHSDIFFQDRLMLNRVNLRYHPPSSALLALIGASTFAFDKYPHRP